MTTIVIIIIVFVAIRVIAQIVSDNQAKEYQKQRNDNRRNASLENPVRKNKLGAYSKSIVYEELSRRGQFGNIFVYSDAKTIVICGREYKFDEIVECHLESQGATYVTTPDRYQMAEQQFLYGMGQRYNVSTQTQVYNNPDKVCITINRLSNSLITITPADQQKALEINSLINVIIHNNHNL